MKNRAVNYQLKRHILVHLMFPLMWASPALSQFDDEGTDLAVNRPQVTAVLSSSALQVQHSSKCLDIVESSDKSGARIVQHECNNTTSQQWKFVPLASGNSQIVSALSGLCLDIAGASTRDGATLQQASCVPTYRHQQWKVRNAGTNSMELVSANSDKCLDVGARSTANGAGIIQWPCHKGPNQLWTKIAPRPATPDAIACERTPEVSVEWTTEWREEMYGGNAIYSNYFTPLMVYKGSSYFVWITPTGLPQVTKITKGVVQTALLAANYKTRINSHNLYSLGIDKKGFIHISGDMQNGPNLRTEAYPTRYRTAKILYWVSKLPESVQGGFEFMGDTSRTIPAKRVNGIRFFTDNYGELYSSAVVDAIEHGAKPGRRGIGLYKYNTTSLTWEALGAKPPRTPDTKPTDILNSVLFWEIGGVGTNGDWQGFFSFFKFDGANHLHFATAVNTDRNMQQENLILYARSVDGGYRWQKASGVPIVGLPLRATDGFANQADVVDEGVFTWQSTVVADRNGRPGIYAIKIEGNSWNDTWYTWTGSAWSTDNRVNTLPNIPHTGNIAPGGSMILTPNQWSQMVYCQKSFATQPYAYKIGALANYHRFTNIDEFGLRHTGVVHGVAINRQTGKQSLLKVTFKPAP